MECANCRKPTQSSRCTGCLSVSYCSTDCQRQNWKTHKTRNYRSASADKIFGPEMDKVFKANFYNGGCALEGTLMSGAMVILPVLI